MSMPWWARTTNQMLAGLLLGTVLGLIFGGEMAAFSPAGDLFITLLQMAAIPLIFFNVITAIAKLPDFITMRRIGAMIILVMRYGPIGVMFLMASSVGQYKSSFFGPVGKYVAGVYLADLLQFGLVYLLFVAIILRGSPWRLLVQSVPVIATAA